MPPGLVALEELTQRHADRDRRPIRPSAACSPTRCCAHAAAPTASGCSAPGPSRTARRSSYDPPILSATVTPRGLGGASPWSWHIRYRGILVDGPFGLPTLRHDRSAIAPSAAVRQTIDPILAAGTPLVLLGDFNMVDREVGYAELSAGLIDAQRAVGLGPGLTWRPESVEWLPFGLLRIDYVFSANGLEPIAIGPDCTPRGSDHCLLHATLELPPSGP